MMKYLLSFVSCLLLSVVPAAAQVSFGRAVLLNDDWRFLRIDSARSIFESADMKSPGYDDSRWPRVTLPHDWGVQQPISPDKGSCQGYLPGGIGWYRRTLQQVDGDAVFLYF